MKRRILVLIFALAVIIACTASVFADGAGLSNFRVTRDYTDGQFTDVSSEDWFAQYVASSFRFSLMNGTSATYFNAKGNVTIAETITLASRLNLIYNTGSSEFENSTPWYKVYVDYALGRGIIAKEYADYNRPATRAEYASIIGASLPDDALRAVNDIADGVIPDVPQSRSYAQSVYRLYRAGVLTGSDSKGTFYPDSNIKRSEVAAIISRLADDSQRKEFSLGTSSGTSDAVSIASKCSPAVFYIEVYDQYGDALCTGSGFFISPDGRAVTNYHVVGNGSEASIKLSNGEIYWVAGVYDYSQALDLALLQIEGDNFPYLELDTSSPVAGQTVYAIGSPYGLDNSISQGIVSNPSRRINDNVYIQFTAPISSGSSGGAVINEAGKVIGVSSASVSGDPDDTVQNLNLAIPVSLIGSLVAEPDGVVPMGEMFHAGTGWLYIENAVDQVVCVDSSKTIDIYYGADDYVTIIYNLIDDSNYYLKAEWGEFDDGFIPLTVTGLNEGLALIEIELWNDDETELLTTSYIWVQIVDASITVSEPQPVLTAGQAMDITFFAELGEYGGSFYLTFEVDDTSVATAEWADEWNEDGTSIDMTIYGVGRGTTKIWVEIRDDIDYAIFGGYITVTVR